MPNDGTKCRECGDEVEVFEAMITKGYHVECEPELEHDEIVWGPGQQAQALGLQCETPEGE